MVINFRGASGVKITSAKMYSAANWTDFKEPLDYIHDKYCSGNNDYLKRNIYGYACSLGAGMLNLYLVKDGSNSKLTGAICFSQPFSMKRNVNFFRQSFYGVYNWIMGLNFALVLWSKLPEMK